MDDDKFKKVAGSYSKMFYYAPYYMTLAELLEKYLGESHNILEVGAADGIVALAWEKLRRESGNEGLLRYFAIEPVEQMVATAREKTKGIIIPPINWTAC